MPADFQVCPGCQASLLAPDLAPRDVVGLSHDSLAPAIASGPRLTPFHDLAAEIAAAPPGATLELGPGVFRLVRPLIVSQALTLNGVGMDQTTIVSMNADFVVHVIGEGLFVARGLTIAHEGRSPADVVLVTAADVQLEDCRISGGFTSSFVREAGGTGKHGRGLALVRTASATLRRCQFVRNVRDGLALLDDAAASVLACTASANQGAGVLLMGRSHVTLDGLRAEGNYLGGVVLRDDARGVLRASHLSRGGAFGAAILQRARATVDRCTFDDNARSGLVVWNEATANVRETSCSRNGEHGLDVRQTAIVEVDGLEAHGNRGHGLSWSDRATGGARGVAASGNGLGDSRVYDQAQPRLEGPPPVRRLPP